MNPLQTIDQGIATKIGYYADAIVIPAGYQQVLVSATPGIDQDGEVADDATGQSEQAWENVTRVLEAAGATVGDIVFTRLWLTRESDIGAGLAVRKRYLTRRPASTVAVVDALERPQFLVALEVVAAIPPEEMGDRADE
jgi:2-iminobutanoate/2-iminopropanoate deaminase